ncbi:MAG: SMP-30/gluconolactonase/LRE family protein [Pseudomonadota bacterium]
MAARACRTARRWTRTAFCGLRDGARVGLIRYAPDGRTDRIIDVPARQPSSCAFGGEDMKTLYVTTAQHGPDAASAGPLDGRLLQLRVETPGLPLPVFPG